MKTRNKTRQIAELEHKLRLRYHCVMSRHRLDVGRMVTLLEGMNRVRRLHPFGPRRIRLP